MADRDRHAELWAVVRKLPTDYADYGGEVQRSAKPDETYPDCSGGCRWAVPLEGELGAAPIRTAAERLPDLLALRRQAWAAGLMGT